MQEGRLYGQGKMSLELSPGLILQILYLSPIHFYTGWVVEPLIRDALEISVFLRYLTILLKIQNSI